MGGSTSHIALRFAAISVLALSIIAGLAGASSYMLARSAEEDFASRNADRLVGEPIRAALEPGTATGGLPLTVEQQGRLDALTEQLLSSNLRGVRLWTPDGQVAYEVGVSAGTSAPSAANGVSSSRVAASDGAALFAAYAPAAGYVLEITQDAAPIDRKIASSQQTAIVVIAVTYVLLCIALQGAFWVATRTVASEHRRLVQLYAHGEDLRSSLDLHDVIMRIASEATTVARADHSLVALFEAETGDLVLRATYDAGTGAVAHQQRAIEEWFLRRAVVTNSTIVSGQSAKAYTQFFGAQMDALDQVNVLVIPMSLRDRVVGVLAIVRVPDGRRTAFTPQDMRQAGDLAAQGAVAVEQALLFAKVRSYAKEVELSYDSTLKAMMAALDAKDDVSEGHGERVARMTGQLARQMGVESDSAIVDMERGALLHDVGTIGVPDAVLKKPTALNDLEWEAMRKHPLLAGMMISKVGFLEGATPILLYHHERFDGGGYPFGLAGDKIPLDARIFSVVDAYDAMTSERPWRDAMTHEQAMAEVGAGSGTQFDPAVVSKFNHMIATHPELRTRPAAPPRERDVHHSDDFAPTPRNADSSAA